MLTLSGFDTTFRPKFPIIGANGVNLQDKWKDYPVDAYMAITVAEMPNVGTGPAFFGSVTDISCLTQYFIYYGPYGPNVCACLAMKSLCLPADNHTR